MAPRIDYQRQHLDLAVADLLDTQLLRSLGFAHRGGYERMWLGQAIHSRYQEAALATDGSYRREVTVRHSFSFRGWSITVQGRIDGLRRMADGTLVVEEIKSVRRGAFISDSTRELYARQAAIYAWMLAREEGYEQIEAELVLIEIGSDVTHREPVEIELRVLDALARRRAASIIRSAEQARTARAARADVGRELAFPYPEQRPGQATIIEAASEALEHSRHLHVEAATGLGKTVSALYPAVRYALEHDKRIFVLTAKTLQQDMAVTVLDLLNEDESFRALRMRAKAKMCANDQVLCHEEYCRFAKDYYTKLEQSGIVHQLARDRPTLLPDDVYAGATEAEVCPFEVSLDLAGRVQVVVCDYNYAFDPYVALRNFRGDDDLSDTILVIDELHNLVDRGRRYYSPSLSARAARAVANESGYHGAPIHIEIRRLANRLADLIEEVTMDAAPPGAAIDDIQRADHGRRDEALGELYQSLGYGAQSDHASQSGYRGAARAEPVPRAWAAEQTFPEDRLWQLRADFDRAFVDYLEHRRETKTLTAEDRFVDLYFALLKFLNALVLEGGAFSHFVERDGDESRWRILCKDASPFLGDVIGRCHTVIGLSATLSPHAFYRDLLGFEAARTDHLSLPSPFPREHRQVVIDRAVATVYRKRPENYPRIAARLSRFADAVPGNVLALFPSYAFLAEIAARLDTSRKRVLVQARSDSDDARDAMLETLRSALLRDVLLLAVAGGVFAEGVDYPGDMLKAVAVIGPCLPALNLDQQLLQQYFDERFERGFEYAFVVPGMTRVVQAAGRLIRRDTDTGVIALMDKRFLIPGYSQHLPEDWFDDGDPRTLAGEPAEVATRFFRDA